MSRDDEPDEEDGFQPGPADERSEEAHSSSSTGSAPFELEPAVESGTRRGLVGVGGVLIRRMTRRPLQWLCGVTLGHKLHPTDRGLLLGSNMVDRWCERCGKMITIPLAEEDYNR